MKHWNMRRLYHWLYNSLRINHILLHRRISGSTLLLLTQIRMGMLPKSSYSYISRACTEPRPVEQKACFNCGHRGHISRECPEKYGPFFYPRYPPASIPLVGAFDHFPFQTPVALHPQPSGGERFREATPHDARQADACFSCGKVGHRSKECPEAHINQRCYKCGEAGHISKACFKNVIKCYTCNNEGHMGKDCPNRTNEKGCYSCGKTDHLSKDCPSKPEEVCYNCGDKGHISRRCPHPKDYNMVCHVCKTKGHRASYCPTLRSSEGKRAAYLDSDRHDHPYHGYNAAHGGGHHFSTSRTNANHGYNGY